MPREVFHDYPGAPISLARRISSRVPLPVRRAFNIGRESVAAWFHSAATALRVTQKKTPTVSEIFNAFEKSSSALLAHLVQVSDRIPRPELGTLEQFPREDSASVLCLLGPPGSGKTALLALFARNALDSQVVTLAIKADLLPSDMAFEIWGQRQLGLDITPIDAVRVAASRSRVLVIIDQLDALARTVDLTSDRLNSLLAFIDECTSIPQVSVICSCRNFDFNHDTRFAALDAEVLDLQLPRWEDVAPHIEKQGVHDASSWPESVRELLRTPQALRIYLDRLTSTRNSDPFSSYQLMLDDLWQRTVETTEERDLLYALTQYLVDNESLWAPRVQFEQYQDVMARLESKHVLQWQGHAVGFRHQTLLEHAKARLFTKSNTSLCAHVLDHQDAIFVRPTVWAVLQYLRGADRAKYRVELESLFNAQLRLHLRYLLIEFLGQLHDLEDFEVALLAERLLTGDDRLRVLIEVRGNVDWFNALRSTHFPAVMRGPADQQWPMAGIIIDAWTFARDECLDLIEQNWLPDPDKDRLTARAMSDLGKWDERSVNLICTLIKRTKNGGDRLFLADSLVSSISADQPTLAPRVFVAVVSREEELDDTTIRHSSVDSPLEQSRGWYDLPAVAEAAPLEFLRTGWHWLVRTCERLHAGYKSTVVNHYTGACFSLEERPGRPEAPIMAAFCAAIDAVAKNSPDEFIAITKPSGASENAVVHRLIVRGLCELVNDRPLIAFEYLMEDTRRFELGSYESDNQSDSIDLIACLTPRLSPEQLRQLETTILSWSRYKDDDDLSDGQREADREARVQLLAAFPPDLISPEASELVQREKAALPDWNTPRMTSRGGFVREIPPVLKDDMLTRSNDDILAAIRASKEPDRAHTVKTEVDGGWEEPGGPHAAGRELSELAKTHPQRAVELIKFLLEHDQEAAALQPIHDLADTKLSDEEVFSFVRGLAAIRQPSEELRSNASYLLYRRCRERVGLPDDLCALLSQWLTGAWDAAYSIFGDDESKEDVPENVDSILWSSAGGFLDTDRSFWTLLALTHGYLMRSPSDFDHWLEVIEGQIDRGISERTWAAFCIELRWIRLQGCDTARGVTLITTLLRRFRGLATRREGVRLIAHVSELLPASFLQEYLDQLRADTRFRARQAFGELLTLIAFRDTTHVWATDRLSSELDSIAENAEATEPIAIGMAFAAAQLWDEPRARANAARVLSRLIPHAKVREGRAIATVFWAREEFTADEATDTLLIAFATNPLSLASIEISDLVEHLISLLPHKRQLVLSVCTAILKSGRQEGNLFEPGANLVKIAMTLQRFSDTRAEGLALLESLLQLGLDDAFRVLRDIDIRPSSAGPPIVRKRRRRRRPE
jgi:hypothetical protein